jgi:hypothetical protein
MCPDAQETVTSTVTRVVIGSIPICRGNGSSSMVEHDTPFPIILGAFYRFRSFPEGKRDGLELAFLKTGGDRDEPFS